MSRSKKVMTGTCVSIGAAFFLAACGSTQQPVVGSGSVSASPSSLNGALFATGNCAPQNLTTRDAGHLNVGYSQAKPPYFVDRTPAEPAGFEVAVVNAIARKLGFNANQVQWKKVAPVQLTAPTRQDLDFSIGQIVSSQVSAGVLRTTPYLTEQQVLLARPNTALAKVTDEEALQGTNLGVVRGSSSETFVRDVLKLQATAYPSNNVLKAAMRDHYINGMVVPLDQVMQVLSTVNDELVVVGQFPARANARTYVLTMVPGDPLITCVNLALDDIRTTGELATLQATWFTTGINRQISVKQ